MDIASALTAVTVALIGAGAATTVAWRSLSEDRKKRSEERRFLERDRFIPLAVQVLYWIDYQIVDRFGMDDFAEILVSVHLNDQGDLGDRLSDLKDISYLHSDQHVRVQARQLADNMESAFIEVFPDGQDRIPNADGFLEWHKSAEKLIEAIRSA